MNIDLLRHFVEVARDGNISSAAKRLRLTQPALSRQMAVFENDTGWKLLERGAKSIKLTRDGETVFRLGKKMIALIDQGIEQIQREIDGEEVRIGYAPSLGGDLLRSAMETFTQLHPRVRISITDASSEEMHQGISDGRYDLIIAVSDSNPSIVWHTLREVQFALAVPVKHSLAKKQRVSPRLLDGEKMLLLSRTDYPGYWREVTDYFREHSINAKVAGEFDGIESMRLGVEAGMGVAFVAKGVRMGKGVKLKSLVPSPDPICVAVGQRADLENHAVLDAFIRELVLAAE